MKTLSARAPFSAIAVLFAALMVTRGLAQQAPPANDDLANALEVTGTEFQLAADLGGATHEAFEPSLQNHYDLGHTAWWTWSAPEDGIYNWDSTASSNWVAVAVYLEDAFEQMIPAATTYRRPVRASTGWALVPDRTGSFQANQGMRYLIQLDLATAPPGWPATNPSGSNSSVSVHFAKSGLVAPASDDFSGRAALTASNAVFTADLSAATAETNEPEIAPGVLHRTLWWTWDAPAFGSATLRTRSAGVAPVVGIFARNALNRLDLMASSATVFGNLCYREARAHNSVEWDVTPGGRYEIQVDRFPNFDTSVPAELELAFVPAPTNDTAAGAVAIQGLEASLVVSNTAATLRSGELVIPAQSGSNSVWFQWTSPAQGVLQVTRFEPVRYADPSYQSTSGAGSDAGYEEWRSMLGPCADDFVDLQPAPPFVPVFGLFDQAYSLPGQLPGPTTLLTWGTNSFISDVDGGRDYWIELDGAWGSSGQTPLNLLLIARPANDDFTNRIVLPAESLRVTGRTFAASREPSDPVYVENNRSLDRSVWWEWSAPTSGRWTFLVTQGGGDNKFVLYRGATPSSTNEAGNTESPIVIFDTAAGETFQIAVFALAGFGGNVEFTLTPLQARAPKLGSLTQNWDLGYAMLTLQLPDNSGLPYVVERSEDLVVWTPVFTNANPSSHWIALQTELGKPAAFFRTRLQDPPIP